ncbi:hypothetical protein JOQ06_022981 [Pogonophryne albipinna]|uniref:Immunoglobulin V-set domain-containing protein n=1 Tax=Pogonophryne albipinna TaxID=1090488 RepID=A0AAD6F4Q2_9TELE|nr:hypothetical protein JOQ06_022981 [Pogonophryne albipinna]
MFLNYRRERNFHIHQSSTQTIIITFIQHAVPAELSFFSDMFCNLIRVQHRPSSSPSFNMLSLQNSAFSLMLFAILSGISCDDLTPVKTEEFSPEGSSVTLSHRYSKQTAGGDYFFWYRQYPGEPPEFLLSISGLNFTNKAESLGSDTRFFTDLSEGKQRVDLQISSAAVTDSAVFYCAVRPTVTGNTITLYKNLWSTDNTILINIHQRESLSDRL